MLSKLCGSIERLAASSTEATQATATLTEHSSASAVAAAAAAATHAQLQHAAPVCLPGPLSRAAAEYVVNNTGYLASLVLKGVAKLASEADVVAAILCHKVLLSDYVPPKPATGAYSTHGPPARPGAEYLTLRSVTSKDCVHLRYKQVACLIEADMNSLTRAAMYACMPAV